MASKLQKQAQALDALRKNQQELAVRRNHKEALRIGQVVGKHEYRIACSYLALKSIPTNTNTGVMVRELAAACAALDSEQDPELRSLLRRAAWNGEAQTTTQVEEALQALPDLDRVKHALRFEE